MHGTKDKNANNDFEIIFNDVCIVVNVWVASTSSQTSRDAHAIMTNIVELRYTNSQGITISRGNG